jgi:hypothetical protein
MPAPAIHRPLPVLLIVGFQYLKAAILLTVTAFLWLAPDALPYSDTFSQVLFIAAHGKKLPSFLVPAFALYVGFIGWRLWNLRPKTRRNLAISLSITIALSLQRLGLFGQTDLHSPIDRESLYILILFDLAIYIYLAFHPAIAESFDEARRRRNTTHLGI